MTLCFDRFFFVCVLRFILQPPAHGMVMESNIKTHQLKKEKIIQGKRERLARKWFKNRRSFGESLLTHLSIRRTAAAWSLGAVLNFFSFNLNSQTMTEEQVHSEVTDGLSD